MRNEHARQVETSQRHGLRRPMDTEYDEGRRTAYLVTLANHLERHRRAVERALITTRARRLAEGARSGDRAEKRKVTGD